MWTLTELSELVGKILKSSSKNGQILARFQFFVKASKRARFLYKRKTLFP